MAVAISLKLSIMRQYFYVSSIYFFYELVINGLIPTFNGDSDAFDPYANVIQQFYDLFIISCLLLVFRPRMWPEYFSLGFEANFPNAQDEEQEVRRLAPLLNAVIDDKAFQSNRSKLQTEFNSNEAVLILNPMDSFDSREENNQSTFANTEISRAYDYHSMNHVPRNAERGSLFSHLKIAFRVPSRMN